MPKLFKLEKNLDSNLVKIKNTLYLFFLTLLQKPNRKANYEVLQYKSTALGNKAVSD